MDIGERAYLAGSVNFWESRLPKILTIRATGNRIALAQDRLQRAIAVVPYPVTKVKLLILCHGAERGISVSAQSELCPFGRGHENNIAGRARRMVA